MALTVLSVAYPFAPVGPEAVGGAEQILGEIDRALVEAGHTSLVVACAGSEVSGKLFPVPLPEGLLDAADRADCVKQVEAAMARALAAAQVDLIHMHGIDFHQYLLPSHIPVLVTLHMPVSWYPASIWNSIGTNVQLQCVSYTQRETCPLEYRHLPVVANGVALPHLRQPEAGDFALVLGRICPEKNVHAALKAGTLAKTRVLIGGRVFPYGAHLKYFREHLWPLLRDAENPPRHEFLGSLRTKRRWRLLQRAKCLLLPTLAPETSSIVAMEALAAGTPVIAYRSGAIPEIVQHGVTGFLSGTPEDMAAAIQRADKLDRQACRQDAVRRFSRERMVREYFRLYDEHIEACSSGSQRSYA